MSAPRGIFALWESCRLEPGSKEYFTDLLLSLDSFTNQIGFMKISILILNGEMNPGGLHVMKFIVSWVE